MFNSLFRLGNYKDSIKSPYYWPFFFFFFFLGGGWGVGWGVGGGVGGGHPFVPLTSPLSKGLWSGKRFHAMALSWLNSNIYIYSFAEQLFALFRISCPEKRRRAYIDKSLKALVYRYRFRQTSIRLNSRVHPRMFRPSRSESIATLLMSWPKPAVLSLWRNSTGPHCGMKWRLIFETQIWSLWNYVVMHKAINTSRADQNGRSFCRRQFQMHLHEKNVLYGYTFHWSLFLMVQSIMAQGSTGDKSSPEPMMTKFTKAT